MSMFNMITISQSVKPILFVITGNRMEVFKNTGAMKGFYEDPSEANIRKIIVTDESNMDIFYNLPNTKVYPMNTETFLILDQQFFGRMIFMPNTELSNAFCKRLSSRKGSITGNLMKVEFDSWEYMYIPAQHPIDIIHNKIRRKGKSLVGINIGENEHVTKKLSYTFLCNLMNYMKTRRECKFVLFGTGNNEIRSEMLRRECHSDIIIMIGDYPIDMFAQAISLCDCFISLNRFLLHLSLSIEQDTIGLFYRDELTDHEDTDNVLPCLSPFIIDGTCEICNDNEECSVIYEDEGYCTDKFNVKDIGSVALDIIESKDK